ncbi:MAG: OmpA family protein [Rhodobacteraceae bacterium]|nr:OmpA family protein [Paracoccaceae bacterium]
MPAGARALFERISPLDSYAIPTGPFDGVAVPVQMIEGRVDRRSWRLEAAVASTLQILAPLREQLEAQGYKIVLDCGDRECGGFDFRFGVEVVPAPDMVVDIGDYRFLTAQKGEEDVVTVLVSKFGANAYLQVISVGSEPIATIPDAPPIAQPVRPASRPQSTEDVDEAESTASDLVARLLAEGHVVLADVAFETGAVQLGDGQYQSLELLAAFLSANDTYRLALVGHTDDVGALQDNISLSRRRAQAVRARLIEQHGVAPARVEADGVGYLAPIASNITQDGRQANRRVEAVLLVQ